MYVKFCKNPECSIWSPSDNGIDYFWKVIEAEQKEMEFLKMGNKAM